MHISTIEHALEQSKLHTRNKKLYSLATTKLLRHDSDPTFVAQYTAQLLKRAEAAPEHQEDLSAILDICIEAYADACGQSVLR